MEIHSIRFAWEGRGRPTKHDSTFRREGCLCLPHINYNYNIIAANGSCNEFL